MIALDSTSKKLELVLEAAHTTNALEASVFYYDVPRQSIQHHTEFLHASSHVASNGTTTVTLLAAPAASITRNVSTINVYNKDTVTQRVIIKIDTGTEYILINVSLTTKQTLIYESSTGWMVL